MNKTGFIFCGCCIVVALFFLIPALDFPGTTKEGTPGPGYYPTIVCSIILILSILLAISYIRNKEKYFQTNETERTNLPVLLITSGAIMLYSVLFIYLPFIPLTIVFVVFLNWLYKRPWLFNIIFSILFPIIIYYVFGKFLRVML
jgi:putative tricarboxylic transport membrane protein